MNFIDLGVWSAPERVSIDGGIIVARYQNADGEDWYETVAHNPNRPTGLALAIDPEDGAVRVIGSEVSRLEPGRKRVIVLPDYVGTEDDQDHLFYKCFDLSTGEFIDRPTGPVLAVSRAQALMALYNAGLLEAVRDEALTHPYEPVRIWFENASTWYRSHPYVSGVALELGLTEEAVDALFLSASLLV